MAAGRSGVTAVGAGRRPRRTGAAGTCWRLDPHAPQTHLPLIAAATRLGIPPARVGRGRRCGSAEPVGSPGWSSWSAGAAAAGRRPTGRATGAVTAP